MSRARSGGPPHLRAVAGHRGCGAEHDAKGLGQHLAQAALLRLEGAAFGCRGQVDAVPRSRERHVHQPLDLLALARGLVRVELRLEVAHRHRVLGRGVRGDPDGRSRPARPASEVHDEHHGELEALRRVHGHQVHGVHRVDNGVRFVAGRQAVEVIREAGKRQVPAVLQPPHEARTSCVLAGGRGAAAPDLVLVGRIRQYPVQEFRGRDPIGQASQSARLERTHASTAASSSSRRPAAGGGTLPVSASAIPGARR